MKMRGIAAAFLGMAGAAMALTSPPRTDYVTYLGGSAADNVIGIAVDATRSAYVAGNTNSPDFPLTSPSVGVALAKCGGAFVTKFNVGGTGILLSYCVENSRAAAFGLDAAGNMYLTLNQANKWVVAKMDPTGHSVYTVPVGGSPEAMAVDAAGNVYVAGSATTDLVATPGAYQPQVAAGLCRAGLAGIGQGPCSDAYVVKLGTTGAVAWATYLGGSGPDIAQAVAVDASGNVWVGGQTVSPNFPVTAGAFQTIFRGELDLGPLRFGDAFVSKLDVGGGKLLYSTFLGGGAPEAVSRIAVDAAGAAYVAGTTQSLDFPTTAGAFQRTNTGGTDAIPSLAGAAFVTKFNAAGTVAYSTYLGNGHQQAAAVAVDAMGQAYVNAVAPPGATAPCTQAAQVSVLDAAGSSVVATSPVGGSYLALDGKGGLYSAGLARTLVSLSTPQAYQTQYGGGGSDGFAGKVDFSQAAGPAIFSIVNAASFFAGYPTSLATGAVAPGEIVSLFGNGFGAAPTVSFDGLAAPVVYASNCQINAVVPFGVSVGGQTLVTVQAGATLGPVKLPVTGAAPGIFTNSGSLQAAVVNQDGTINSSSNSAPRGSVIAVYITGAGSLMPPLADGSTGPFAAPFPMPTLAVSARIGLIDAPVFFAGQAPGLIAGATQVNVQIPQNSPTGPGLGLSVWVGGYVTQINPGVVVSIR